MSDSTLPRESADYLEILTDVFSEVIDEQSCKSESSDDITPSLAQCLQFVFLHGQSPIGKIAAGLSITVPAASQLVDRLVQKQLVLREIRSEDRRQSYVTLTDAGKSFAEHNKAARTDWFKSIMAGMSDDKRASLVDGLEEFIRVAIEKGSDAECACVRCGIEHVAFCVVSKAHLDTTGEQMKDF